MSLIIDIAELYKKTFGKEAFVLPGINTGTDTSDTANDYRLFKSKAEREFTKTGAVVFEKYRGVEVMLPLRFFNGSELLTYMPYCVINVSGGANIIETKLSGRVGSVKEIFNIEDYKFNVKGFLISEDRQFPEKEIENLRKLFELQYAVIADNALINIFTQNSSLPVSEQKRIVIYDLAFPEVQGGRENVRPFTMSLKSDAMFTLEYA